MRRAVSAVLLVGVAACGSSSALTARELDELGAARARISTYCLAVSEGGAGEAPRATVAAARRLAAIAAAKPDARYAGRSMRAVLEGVVAQLRAGCDRSLAGELGRVLRGL